MEIVLATLIGSVSAIIMALLLQHNKERSLKISKEYEKDLYKLKKREGRKDKKLASEINTKPPKSSFEKGSDLMKAINKLAGYIDLNEGEDYSIEEEEPIMGTLAKLIDSPIGKGFINAISKKAEGDEKPDVFKEAVWE